MSSRGFTTGTETKVQQQFRDETKPQKIVERFNNTGQMPLGTNQEPLFLDHTQYEDFHEQLNRVTEMQQKFMMLPPQLRYRFNNNPTKLAEFLNDDKNQDESIKLGLINKPEGYLTPSERAIEALKNKKATEESQKPTSTPEGANKPPEKEA